MYIWRKENMKLYDHEKNDDGGDDLANECTI